MDLFELNRPVRVALILTLFALAGATVWGYICQRSLRDRRVSLKSLLGLVLAIAVAIQLGLMFLAFVAASQID